MQRLVSLGAGCRVTLVHGHLRPAAVPAIGLCASRGADRDADLVYLENNHACLTQSAGGGCSDVAMEAGVQEQTSPLWPELTVPRIRPALLVTRKFFEWVGPGYVSAEAERVWGEFADETLRVGGNFDPSEYLPAPFIVEHGPDYDRDGIPDEVDQLPTLFSAWSDSDGDGWSDLVEHGGGKL